MLFVYDKGLKGGGPRPKTVVQIGRFTYEDRTLSGEDEGVGFTED